MITFLGGDISSSSFAMYTSSAAVLVQAIMLIVGSSFADYGMYTIPRCPPSSHFMPTHPPGSVLLLAPHYVNDPYI